MSCAPAAKNSEAMSHLLPVRSGGIDMDTTKCRPFCLVLLAVSLVVARYCPRDATELGRKGVPAGRGHGE
jgi:hypothetical protein